MSAVNSTPIVPGFAQVFLAPVGTAAPTTPGGAPSDDWLDVGYTTQDSLSFATAPSFETITAHQADYPIRTFQTADSATLQVDLEQWNAANFQAVFGGGTITSTGTSPNVVYRFAPPAVGARQNVAALVQVTDGTVSWLRVIPKAFQSDGVTQSLSKTAGSTLPLRLTVLGSSNADPWYDLTNLDFSTPLYT